MSVQVAMMAATAGLSAFSSIAAGNAKASGLNQMAGGKELEGKQDDVQIAETRAQVQNEELQRRKGLANLLSANRADLSGRNVSGEQGSSFDVIQDYNRDQSSADIGNLRFMGESRVRRLSFAKQSSLFEAGEYRNMAGQAQTAGWLGAARSLGGMALSYFGMPKFGGFGGGGGGGMTSTQMGGPDGFGGMG